MSLLLLEPVLTCTHCGYFNRETMPTDACLGYYHCEQCQALLQLTGRITDNDGRHRYIERKCSTFLSPIAACKTVLVMSPYVTCSRAATSPVISVLGCFAIGIESRKFEGS